jgi:hypothetical protein
LRSTLAAPEIIPGDLGSLEPTQHHWLNRLVRIMAPPTVTLPGDGPILAVDARGLSADDLAAQVDGFQDRTIFIVDDPDIAWLRTRRLHYEYAPATPAVSSEDRLDWITAAYGVDLVVRLNSAGVATTHWPAHRPPEESR